MSLNEIKGAYHLHSCNDNEIARLRSEIKERDQKILNLRNYVKISYNETKFYFAKLQKIELILTDSGTKLNEQTKQEILDILYED